MHTNTAAMSKMNSAATNPAATSTAALRIIDANFNRAAEGLRVVEDYTRFVLNDVSLTAQLKQLRHSLTAALSPLHDLLTPCRDAQNDAGTAESTATEYHRADERAVAAASFKRVAQALRCIEEYAKTLDADIGRAVEPLRYQIYTFERVVLNLAASQAAFDGVRLQVLLDGRPGEDEFASLAEKLIDAGAGVIQLRDKTLPDRVLLQRAHVLRRLTRSSDTLFIMNDRPDLARLADADGVHVGQEELQVADARTIIGPRRMTGVSTHSLQQAQQAARDGAAYIGVGPVFPSSTKQFSQFAGVTLLNEVSRQISLPAFAIGGITLKNLSQVTAAGFSRVAVAGAVLQAADPAATVREFNSRLAACSITATDGGS